MKYEITDIQHPDNPKLHRIKSLMDFVDVETGDLGGYIESEDNLSQDGECWVYRDAQVYGNAEVSDDALVFGHAEVHGNAKIYGNAMVFGHAEVYGNTEVFDNANIAGRSKIFGDNIISGNTYIKIP